MKGYRVAAITTALSMLGSGTALTFGSNVDVSAHQSSYERERSAEEWAKLRDNTIEWDEIQDLVHEYNPTVADLWITFRENDHDGLYNIDFEEALEAVESSYSDSLDAASTDIEVALADLSYITSSARTSIDSTAQSTDRQASIYQIQQSEKTVTETVRKAIITLYATELQNQLNELTIQQNQSTYDSTVRKQAVGQATALDVLTAQETLEQSQLSAKSSNTSLEQAKQTLNVSLGFSYDAAPEICAVPMPSDEELDALNLESDTLLALQNNYAILIDERKMAVSSVESNVATQAATIENEKEAVRSDMISRYQAVSQARGSLTQARLTAQNAQSSYDKVARSYSVGGASARDLESAQYTLDSANISVSIAEYTLATEYYDYLAGRDGIASAS